MSANRPSDYKVSGVQFAGFSGVAAALSAAQPMPYTATLAAAAAATTGTQMPVTSEIEIRIELAEQRAKGDVQALKTETAVTQNAVSGLTARFDDFSKQMASVPTDVAALKATLATLPDKDWVSGKLRSSMMIGLGIASLMAAAMQLAIRFALPH